MSDPASPADDQAMTLDPPGSIAVVGAGVLGIEAALYGRFLGYDVTLLEAVSVGSRLMEQPDAPLPLLPNRSLSPLALAALEAQSSEPTPVVLPTTTGQWVERALVGLTQTDLLRGRLRAPFRVTEIVHVPVAHEAEDAAEEQPIPPDFRLICDTGKGQSESIDAEAVILAVGSGDHIQVGIPLPAPYFFRIGDFSTVNWETDLRNGLREIVAIYAELAGRAELDLYRPRRV